MSTIEFVGARLVPSYRCYHGSRVYGLHATRNTTAVVLTEEHVTAMLFAGEEPYHTQPTCLRHERGATIHVWDRPRNQLPLNCTLVIALGARRVAVRLKRGGSRARATLRTIVVF